MVGYVVAGVLVGLLGIASLIAMAVGLLGVFGLLRIVRCESCDHLTVSTGGPASACAYCRHPHFAHPIGSWTHHSHAHR